MISLSYGGLNLTRILKADNLLNPTAHQVASFFGIAGIQSVHGGSRGRVFQIRGIWVGSTIADIKSQEATLETYADGIGRQLTITYSDTSSYSWSAVVYRNEYAPGGPPYPQVASGNYIQEFRFQLHGLI